MARIHARKPLTRSATNLSANLNQRLLGYATAATAAGVGALALAQPAEAKIIYTAANIPITVNGSPVQLDLNHDGIIDFSFINFSGLGICTERKVRHGAKVGHPNTLTCFIDYLKVVPAQAGNAIGSSQSFNGAQCAAELRAGHTIESGRKFDAFNAYMFQSAFGTYNGSIVENIQNCLWKGKRNLGGWLGLQFMAGGQTFYGWARVALTRSGPVLQGYAYEDTPNQPIGAGDTGGAKADASHPSDIPTPVAQPATLGWLANGASGLNAWRRREELNEAAALETASRPD